MQSKKKPVLAKAIETTPDALILIMESGPVSIPWEQCSERLARASLLERNRAEHSPSGYSIHWPLIDENLAVGPLLRAGSWSAADERGQLRHRFDRTVLELNDVGVDDHRGHAGSFSLWPRHTWSASRKSAWGRHRSCNEDRWLFPSSASALRVHQSASSFDLTRDRFDVEIMA